VQDGEVHGGNFDDGGWEAGRSAGGDREAHASWTGSQVDKAGTSHASSAATSGPLTTYILEPTWVSVEYAISIHGRALDAELARGNGVTASALQALPAPRAPQPLIFLSVMTSDVEGTF
jgi:hypothetical protein